MNRLHVVMPQARALATALRPELPGVEIVEADGVAALAGRAEEVAALVAFPGALDQPLVERMARLRWLQLVTAGRDPLDALDLGDVVVTTVGGVHGPQMSEHAFLLLLALRRDLPGLLAQQAAHDWRPAPRPLLAGSRLLVIGVGRIAEALARRAQAFGMRVTGVSHGRTEAPGFDAIVPTARLREAAAEADHAVVLAPLSADTHKLVSRAVIAALPRHAVLINLSRGPVVDEAALIEALREGRIAGAGLDVFAHEPLPADSPWWNLPNVIVTPHVGGWSTAFVEQVTPVIATNARRWFAGERPLVNESR